MKNSTDMKAEPITSMKPSLISRIKFERAPVMADITAFYCANPHCPCRSVTLDFFDANGQFNNRLFKLVVNYETWQLESSEAFKDDMDYAELMDEFMSSLDDQFKSEILSGIEAKAPNEHALRDDINISDSDLDSLVYYSEIYRTGPLDDLIFELDGKEYYVLDHYCPKPKCDCKDVVLAFYLLNGGVVKSEPILSYRVKFGTGKGTIEDKGANVSLRFAKELYGRLSINFGGSAIGFFENRYRKIKEWGAVYFNDAPVKTSPQKTPRNAPCPCGSGKKYKKCCGY